MKVLVMAAHPDDEVLGCGGTIARHSEKGDEVHVLIATKAYAPQWSEEYMERKAKEQKEVDALLGIKKRFNLGWPTVRLNTIASGDFNRSFGDVAKEVKPDIIYAHFPHDINIDHQLVAQAACVAARPPNRCSLLFYETLSETEWGLVQFAPSRYVVLGESQIAKKTGAFSVYESEVKNPPHPRNGQGIVGLAKKRGAEVCSEYAEAFIVAREIV